MYDQRNVCLFNGAKFSELLTNSLSAHLEIVTHNCAAVGVVRAWSTAPHPRPLPLFPLLSCGWTVNWSQ